MSDNTQLAVTEKNAAIRIALKTSLYPGASDGSVDIVLAYCQATGLDPLTKPVHIVPMSVKVGKDERGYDIKEQRDVVMPGIGLYRINAARTGAYAGCSEPEFGPLKSMAVTKDVWKDGANGRRTKSTVDGGTFEYPEWCRITVTRIVEGIAREFSAKEYWIENYATAGNDSDTPNSMWKKRPFGQLAKCTEAQALRKAFPEAVGSQPTADEMEGKVIEGESTVVATTERVAMPQPKAKVIEHQPAKPADDIAESDPVGEPGMHLASAGQTKLLTAKARNAGFVDEAGEFDEPALLAKFPRIDTSNINDVLAQLQKIAEAQDAG